MPTTFNAVFLGNLADIDSTEGNQVAESASALVGLSFGGKGGGQSLVNDFVTISPSTPSFDSDGNTYYDMNDPTPEAFSVDGGAAQFFDGTSIYNATVTYLDGTTATISAVIFQDTAGNTYWAPEFSDNTDQAALEDKSIASLSLDSLAGDTFSGLTGNRETWDFVPCFTPGARIATASGPRPVEALRVGDLLRTRDNGLEPIRWIGAATCRAEGAMTPVRIRAGSLGCGLPERDLLVSQQHRMLIRSPIALRMFGSAEVLVAAKKLLELPGIALATDLREITYMHLLCDRHEVVFADGAPSETLLTGSQALEALGPDGRAELQTLFPDMAHADAVPARIIPRGTTARGLVRRHRRNARPALTA